MDEDDCIHEGIECEDSDCPCACDDCPAEEDIDWEAVMNPSYES